jgi:V/A-type H+-transporting ATPase subunit I
MPWSDRLTPVTMQRIALVAPQAVLRDTLVRVADAGTVEVELPEVAAGANGEATRRLQRMGGLPAPVLAAEAPDLDELERTGRLDLLAGEAAVEQVMAAAVSSELASAVAGWAPAGALPDLASDLVDLGGAVVRLPRPVGVDPPTLLRRRSSGQTFTTLVETYASVPYADVDPTPFAAAAFVVMFGMMFGDVGQGLMLVLAALLAHAGRPRVLTRLGGAAGFLAALGVSGICFGFLYGEFFGPTGVIPVLWISPTDEPLTLLVTALGVGAVLLAVAYLIGTVNRVREGGWAYALYAPAGIAGFTVFLGAGLLVAGVGTGDGWLVAAGAAVALTGCTLAFLGLFAATDGGGSGVAEATVELFDLVLRLGANVLSFSRLAAFGLTHAALLAVVWSATTALWGSSLLGAMAAVVVFVVGNVAAFALEGLVAAVQALRLAYYELFSRVFQAEGRPFRPWHIPLAVRSTARPLPEVQP